MRTGERTGERSGEQAGERGAQERRSERERAVSELTAVVRDLSAACARLSFAAPVAHVYDPLDYARAAAEAYVEKWTRVRPKALHLGMNPGPFGMVQTGVPFGEVAAVRDWLGIDGGVRAPREQFEARPVEGFACTRSEVSGRRVWGWAAERFGTPERFFEHFFVWNYCPLAFLEEGGRNRTPDKLPAAERDALYAVCDRALVRVVAALDPEFVIGVGRFALDRARAALPDGHGRTLGTILHPSPASPIANRGWAPQAERQLAALGIDLGS
jgi:single-strand selective monofunctional uracil DNA glycosylase